MESALNSLCPNRKTDFHDMIAARSLGELAFAQREATRTTHRLEKAGLIGRVLKKFALPLLSTIIAKSLDRLSRACERNSYVLAGLEKRISESEVQPTGDFAGAIVGLDGLKASVRDLRGVVADLDKDARVDAVLASALAEFHKQTAQVYDAAESLRWMLMQFEHPATADPAATASTPQALDDALSHLDNR